MRPSRSNVPNLALAALAILAVAAVGAYGAACSRPASAPPKAEDPTTATRATAQTAPAAPAAPSAEAASASAPSASGPLAGTAWRLVEIQSMDDSIGTTKPEDPSRYTVAFGADGQVAMGLDCNRGTGPWKATPGTSGDSGSIAIGPLAATRALCPSPSLGERIARDMDHVRGYFLRDGKLSLSLEADAAIYLWEPDPAATASAP